MDKPILRLLIQAKITEGRLPHERLVRPVAGPGRGETCDGCGVSVTTAQMMMAGWEKNGSDVRFHMACFYVWEVERQLPAHAQPMRHAPTPTSASHVRFPRQA